MGRTLGRTSPDFSLEKSVGDCSLVKYSSKMPLSYCTYCKEVQSELISELDSYTCKGELSYALCTCRAPPRGVHIK